METKLQLYFEDGARPALTPEYILRGDQKDLIPLVGDKVVLDDGAWTVKERQFDFRNGPTVRLLVGRSEQ